MNYALVTEVHFIHEVLSSVGVINVCVRARAQHTPVCRGRAGKSGAMWQ